MAWMINQRDQGALVGVLELSDEKLRQMEEKNRPIMEKADQDGNGCLTIEEVVRAFFFLSKTSGAIQEPTNLNNNII